MKTSSLHKLRKCFLAGTMAIAGALGSSLQADSVIWWRFNDLGTTITNFGTGGADYDLELPPEASFSNVVSGPYISDGQGNLLGNSGSYRNHGAGSGAEWGAAAKAGFGEILQGSFTIEAIVRFDVDAPYFQALIGNSANPSGAFILGTDSTGGFRLYAQARQGADPIYHLRSEVSLQKDTWYNLAVVGVWDELANATTVQLYINGIAAGESHQYQGGLLLDTSDSLWMGAKNALSGYLDELRISNVALDPSEFLSPQAIPEPGIYGWMVIAGGALWLFLRRERKVRCGVACSVMVATATACAEPVAWWRFEKGFQSEVNAAKLEMESADSHRLINDVPSSTLLVDGRRVQNGLAFENVEKVSLLCQRAEIIDRTLQRSSFTIEAFVKIPENLSEENLRFQRIIGNATNELAGGWCLMVHNGHLRFYGHQGRNGEIVQVTGFHELADGKWHHVAVVGLYDSAGLSIQLLVDGETDSDLVELFPDKKGNAIQPVEAPYLIGGYNRFHGVIDEIRISNTALSASELMTTK